MSQKLDSSDFSTFQINLENVAQKYDLFERNEFLILCEIPKGSILLLKTKEEYKIVFPIEIDSLQPIIIHSSNYFKFFGEKPFKIVRNNSIDTIRHISKYPVFNNHIGMYFDPKHKHYTLKNDNEYVECLY